MNVHKNARMKAHGRLLLVARVREQGWRVSDAELAAGVSVRTAYKWLALYRAGGAPARSPCRLPLEVTAEIERLRRQRLSGPQIARRLARPRPPVIRYQPATPGELLHLDTKKLGRIDGSGHRITGNRRDTKHGAGWEVLHVAIDDAARLTYSKVLPDERRISATSSLDRALAWFARYGVTVERILTDNGSAYRSHDFRRACAYAGLRHLRTRPYTPRTNGKAERFIQTALREWAYARPYAGSSERPLAIDPWQHHYNHHRPHAGINGATPADRLNNLLGIDS